MRGEGEGEGGGGGTCDARGVPGGVMATGHSPQDSERNAGDDGREGGRERDGGRHGGADMGGGADLGGQV